LRFLVSPPDFNGDGNADILWQNADGTPAIWEMNGTAITGGGVLLNPGASWHVIGPSDFNGDGKADIVFQNADGTPAIWEMNGTSIIGGGPLPNPGPSWQIKDDEPISPGQQPALQLGSPDGAASAGSSSVALGRLAGLSRLTGPDPIPFNVLHAT
jgi:FG-GAP-like repeat